MKKCHCGKPLHYTDPNVERFVLQQIERLGEFIMVQSVDGKQYKVPRHFIALHGIKGNKLDTYGFEEIKA